MTTLHANRDVRIVALVLLSAVVLTFVGVGHRAEAIDPPVDVVYVATGNNFADALVGSVVAAMNGAPLLTVKSPDFGDEIPESTSKKLAELKPARIVIYGGEAAVSKKVAGELAAFTGKVERVGGVDRYDTAALIADLVPDAVKEALFAREAGNAKTADRATKADTAKKADDADKLDGQDASDFVSSDRLVPLQVWASFGETVTVNTNGPLSLVLKCEAGDLDNQNDGADQRTTVVIKTSALVRTNNNVELSPGSEHIVAQVGSFDNTNAAASGRNMNPTGLMTEAGHYLGIDDWGSFAAVNFGPDDCTYNAMLLRNVP